MTLIIGLEEPEANRVILAADSGAWRGDQIDILRTPKIWRSNGWIAGLSGQWASSLCARGVPFPEMLPEVTREQLELALLDWSAKATTALGELEDRTKRAGGPQDSPGSSLLVAHGRWLWYVHSGCVVSVDRGYHAVGAEDYALGALSVLTGTPALAAAQMTMLAVARISRAIEPPFRFMATDGQEGVWQ